MGQAQFAHILQPILQEIADNLSEKPVIIIHNVKVASGARIQKVMACPQGHRFTYIV